MGERRPSGGQAVAVCAALERGAGWGRREGEPPLLPHSPQPSPSVQADPGLCEAARAAGGAQGERYGGPLHLLPAPRPRLRNHREPRDAPGFPDRCRAGLGSV